MRDEKVFVGDLLTAAAAEQAACPRCHGTGKRTVEIGPASCRTYEEECPHGISVGAVLNRVQDIEAWDSWTWYGALNANTRLSFAFSLDGEYAIEDSRYSIRLMRRRVEDTLRKGRKETIFEAYKLVRP